MTTPWLLTTIANLLLFALLMWKRPPKSRLLWIAQSEAIVSTAVILTAQYTLPPDQGLNDALFNMVWTTLDLLDAAAECLAIRWAWNNCKDWMAAVSMILMANHLLMKRAEYAVYDKYLTQDWMPIFQHRQWLNLFNILLLCVLVYKRGASAQRRTYDEGRDSGIAAGI